MVEQSDRDISAWDARLKQQLERSFHNYHKRRIDLSVARDNEKYDWTGEILIVEKASSSSANATVRLNFDDADELVLEENVEIKSIFGKLYITNTVQADSWIDVIAGINFEYQKKLAEAAGGSTEPKKILMAANGTPVVWAHSDYAGQGGARTHQINLGGLGVGLSRQGAKADMDRDDVANRMPQRWAVTLRIEMDVAPADYQTVDLFWAASLSATAGTANPGGTTGADAGYTGTPGSQASEGLAQMQYIGCLPLTNDADGVIQQKTFITTLPTQWGMPVVTNYSDQAFEGDGVEMSITFTPLEDEEQ